MGFIWTWGWSLDRIGVRGVAAEMALSGAEWGIARLWIGKLKVCEMDELQQSGSHLRLGLWI